MTPLLFKSILLTLFFGAVVALGCGYYFLLKDRGKRRRVANALLLRVTLCAILLGLMVYGYYAGYIEMTSPVNLRR